MIISFANDILSAPYLDRLPVTLYWDFVSSTDVSQGATPCVYNCRLTRD